MCRKHTTRKKVEIMSFQERNIITYLLTGIVVMAIYTLHMRGLFDAGVMDGPNAGVEIGWSALKLIGGSIVVTIVVTIIVSIINAIITQETDMDEGDERDRQIDLLGMKVGFIAFSVLFIGIFIALALGLATSVALVAMIYAMWFSSIIEGVVRLVIYRRGF